LSTLSPQTLLAAIARSLSQEGKVLSGTVDGSMMSFSSLAVVLLAEPCSPWRTRIGKGPSGCMAPRSQEMISTRSFSVFTLKNRPISSIVAEVSPG
jgi:hypothetical protein